MVPSATPTIYWKRRYQSRHDEAPSTGRGEPAAGANGLKLPPDTYRRRQTANAVRRRGRPSEAQEAAEDRVPRSARHTGTTGTRAACPRDAPESPSTADHR